MVYLRSTRRKEQKQLTQDKLLSSALALLAEGRSLGELSLREVTQRVGLVPAAFYRHFASIEELGLRLVDECGERLRDLLKRARTEAAYRKALLSSIHLFFAYVDENRALFGFIARERNGGNSKIRAKIRKTMRAISEDLALDMRMPKQTPKPDTEFAADMIVGISFQKASDFLDLESGETGKLRRLQWETIKQIRLVFVGTIRGRKNRSKKLPSV